MEARSITYFQERRNSDIAIHAVIYQQCDGSLEGSGSKLAAFLKRVLILTSMERGPEAEYKDNKIVCHGFGDLVARFIKKLKKDKRGDFYLNPAIAADKKEGYVYYVTIADSEVFVQVRGLQWTERGNVEMIDDNLTSEMSIDEFVSLCETGKVWKSQELCACCLIRIDN